MMSDPYCIATYLVPGRFTDSAGSPQSAPVREPDTFLLNVYAFPRGPKQDGPVIRVTFGPLEQNWFQLKESDLHVLSIPRTANTTKIDTPGRLVSIEGTRTATDRNHILLQVSSIDTASGRAMKLTIGEDETEGATTEFSPFQTDHFTTLTCRFRDATPTEIYDKDVVSATEIVSSHAVASEHRLGHRPANIGE